MIIIKEAVMRYNKSNIASFDIDAQKGFTPLCPAELPVPDGDLIGPELNKNATFAKYRIGSKDAHNENAVWVATSEKPQFSKVGLPNVDIRWNSHCNVGTRGFELLDDLPDPLDYDFFIWKGIENNTHPYGACYHDLANKRSTGVIEFLHSKKIEVIIAGGLATDYCVYTTVVQLVEAGFTVVLNLAACCGIAEDTIKTALEKMKEMGVIIVDDIKKWADDNIVV